MVDQFLDRIWDGDRDRYADGVDDVAAGLRTLFDRFAAWDGTTHQLLALIVSFAITAISFQTTAA